MWLSLAAHYIRAVPDFGSGRNPALFPNPAEIRLRQKIPPEPDSFAGFEKLIFPRH